MLSSAGQQDEEFGPFCQNIQKLYELDTEAEGDHRQGRRGKKEKKKCGLFDWLSRNGAKFNKVRWML